MFSHFTTDASISRQARTGDKTSFVAVAGTIQGHLRPLADEKQNYGLENMADMFSFTVSSVEDIREGDRLTIDSDTYSVKGVNTHSGIRVSYMRCILVKEKEGR